MSATSLSLLQTLSGIDDVPRSEGIHDTTAPITTLSGPEINGSGPRASSVPLTEVPVHQAEKVKSVSTNQGQLQYMAKSEMLSQSLQDHWNNILHPQITYHLTSLPSPGPFALDLVVASAKHKIATKLKPSIIVRCISKKQQREVTKSFRTLIWKSRFKDAGCKLRVLSEDGCQEIGGVLEEAAMHQALNFQQGTQNALSEKSAAVTSSGRLIWKERSVSTELQSENERLPATIVATLGGIVNIDGRIFGITVAHPFIVTADRSHHSDVPASPEYQASSMDDEQDDVASDSDNFFSDSSDAEDSVSCTPEHLPQDQEKRSVDPVQDSLQPHRLRSQENSCCRLVALCLGDQIETYTRSVSKRADRQPEINPPDWALVELDASCLLPNSYLEIGKSQNTGRTFITETLCSDSSASGDVNILSARSGTRSGYLSPTLATIFLRGRQVSVQQIYLDSGLGR